MTFKQIHKMKTIKRLCILSLVFYCSNLSAQQESTLVGLRVGVNYSTFILRNQHESFDESGNFSGRQGIQVSVYTQQDLNNNIAAKLEVSFIQKGANVNITKTRQPNYYHLQYISIPVFLAYRKGQFEIEAGLGISLLINGRYYFTKRKLSLAEHFNKNQDLCFHAGFLWHLSKLNIGFRYSRGFVNLLDLQLRDSRGILIPKQPAFYNQSLQVSFAYQFK